VMTPIRVARDVTAACGEAASVAGPRCGARIVNGHNDDRIWIQWFPTPA